MILKTVFMIIIVSFVLGEEDSAAERTFARPYICLQDKHSGFCLAYMSRYYYDPVTNTCKQFIYGGCGGNQNNFLSYERCRQVCRPLIRSG